MQLDWRFRLPWQPDRGKKLLIVWRDYQEATGICSELPDGGHFLLWDFDVTPDLDGLGLVAEALRAIQERYELPAIRLLRSSPNGMHAYCFKRCSWLQANEIIAGTESIDLGYTKLGLIRGYYTLRISDKQPGDFMLLAELPGVGEWDVDPRVAERRIQYQTMHVGSGEK